jgi:hypothetical protein
MGRAELILVFGAIAIFGIYTLTILDMQLQNRISNVNRKYEDAAVSLAHSYLNMAGNEKFDENVNSEGERKPGKNFTHPDSLGPESGEIYSADYNDVDDYNGLQNDTLIVDIKGENFYRFKVNFTVNYVNYNGSKWVNISGRSNHKKIKMQLKSEYLQSDVIFTRVISFR